MGFGDVLETQGCCLGGNKQNVDATLLRVLFFFTITPLLSFSFQLDCFCLWALIILNLGKFEYLSCQLCIFHRWFCCDIPISVLWLDSIFMLVDYMGLCIYVYIVTGEENSTVLQLFLSLNLGHSSRDQKTGVWLILKRLFSVMVKRNFKLILVKLATFVES